MKIRMLFLASAIAAGTAMLAAATASGQGMQGNMNPSMMQGGTGQQPPQHGMMQGRTNGGMMMQGGMGNGMMCNGMMGHGMMGGGMMGSRTMGSGMTRSGMGALFGSRVTPVMNLSADDVRGYLAARLDRLNNKRLKVGDIKSGDGTITADIVTVDNSLVQRLKVDPHTGAITYEN